MKRRSPRFKLLIPKYASSQHANGISFLKRLKNFKIMMDNEIKQLKRIFFFGEGWVGMISSMELSPGSTQPGPA